MSTPFHPSGIAHRIHVPRVRVGADRIGRDHVGGDHDLSGREQLATVFDLVGLYERVTDAPALRDEERERHRPADQELIALRRAARRSRRACR